MYKFLSKDFFYYSITLLPLTYLIGIFITEIFVMLVILFFLVKNRDLSYFKDIKFIFLFFIAIYIGLNGFFQIESNLNLSSIFYFRLIFFSLAVLFCLNYYESVKKKNIIFYIYFIVILFVLSDAFFQFLSGKNLLGYKIINNRISGIFGSELILGSFLFKIIPIITWLIFYTDFNIRNNRKKLIFFFSFYILVIFLTGERTSLGLTILFFILVIILLKPLRKIFVISSFNLVILVFIISILNLGKTDPINRIFVKTYNEFTIGFDQVYTKKKYKDVLINNSVTKKIKIEKNFLFFSKDHNGHFTLAYELFKSSPVFGVGPKGFRSFCRKVDYNPKIGMCTTHPHNFLVQIASETGLVGLSIYCYIIFFLIYKLSLLLKRKDLKNDRLSLIVITIGILVNLFPFFPSGNFFNNWISIIIYYNVGIYLYTYKKYFLT